MGRKQRDARDSTPSAHIIQLFDTTESLTDVLSRFVTDALRRDASVLVVARPRTWNAVAVHLVQHGMPVGQEVERGRITVLHAAAVMRRFMRDGKPDPELFRSVTEPVLERLLDTSPAGVYVYGEMVDLLAEEGDFTAARQLEALWNELGARYRFTLLCGYCAAHFAAPNAGRALEDICRAHSHATADPADPLGMWLLATDGLGGTRELATSRTR